MKWLRDSWLGILFFAAIIAGIFYSFLRDDRGGTSGGAKRPPVAGWEQLDACSPVQSLDGTKELTFFEDHAVNLSEKEVQTQRARATDTVAGTWAFDENANRYFVTLAQQQKTYTLVQPKNSEVCILMSGELAAANVGESWFGRTLQDLDNDVEPSDRY